MKKITVMMIGLAVIALSFGLVLTGCDAEDIISNALSGSQTLTLSGDVVDGSNNPIASAISFDSFFGEGGGSNPKGLLSAAGLDPVSVPNTGTLSYLLKTPENYDTLAFPNNFPGVSLTPSSAKVLCVIGFYQSAGNYNLHYKRANTHEAFFFYSDIACVVTGAFPNGTDPDITLNISLSAGWNYVILDQTANTMTNAPLNILGTGYRWVVDN